MGLRCRFGWHKFVNKIKLEPYYDVASDTVMTVVSWPRQLRQVCKRCGTEGEKWTEY